MYEKLQGKRRYFEMHIPEIICKKCMINYKERDDIFEMNIPEIIYDIMNRNVSA
jgi:hypothetical protein